jgi:hypothetical protein
MQRPYTDDTMTLSKGAEPNRPMLVHDILRDARLVDAVHRGLGLAVVGVDERESDRIADRRALGHIANVVAHVRDDVQRSTEQHDVGIVRGRERLDGGGFGHRRSPNGWGYLGFVASPLRRLVRPLGRLSSKVRDPSRHLVRQSYRTVRRVRK